jgi:hypothetical protein
MNFLALKDRSILYSGYSSVGYIYFPQYINAGEAKLTVPFVRGDPSKDWVSPPTYEFPAHSEVKLCKNKMGCGDKQFNERWEATKAPASPDRYQEFDLSPIVCECTISLGECNPRKNNTRAEEGPKYFLCKAVGGRLDEKACATIGSDVQPAVDNEEPTSDVWPKFDFSTDWQQRD